MPIYGAQHKTLEELLTRASANATVLIPDLQRPYVWTPRQITVLVDSLLRGWPFGTLLLWNLGAVAQDQTLIPSRAFWSTVSRVDGDHGQAYVPAVHPNEFLMVLDGQQRLQSLLIAFGSDGAAITLLDKQWKEALFGSSPYRGSNVNRHWTRGSLYLDIERLAEQLDNDPDGPDVRPNPDYEQMLAWVTTGQNGSQNDLPRRPDNYSYPLPSALMQRGRFIRLSRLWRSAEGAAAQTRAQLRTVARNILEQHDVPANQVNRLWRAIVTILERLHAAQIQPVQYLQLNRFEQSGYTDRDSFNSAVVNIFTRLNRAGRTLTREEITFAWIKVEWPAAVGEQAAATESIEKLRTELNAIDEGFKLETDDVVRLLSTVWSVFERNGQPVRDSDLLDGQTVRSLAAWLRQRWAILHQGLTGIAQHIVELGLKFNVHYRSMNALTLLACLRLSYDFHANRADLNQQQRVIFLGQGDRLLDDRAAAWMIISQWAGLWAQGTDEAVEARTRRLAIQTADGAREGADAFHNRMSEELRRWLSDLRASALEFVQSLSASSRSVTGYHVPLSIWQSRDQARKVQSELVLTAPRTRKAPTLEVDHIFPWSVWEAATAGEQNVELQAWGNSIGNCMLLTKTFNVSKNAKSLNRWLGELNNQNIEHGAWKEALCIPEVMAAFEAPVTHTEITEVRRLIEERERLIKNDLSDYVNQQTE